MIICYDGDASVFGASGEPEHEAQVMDDGFFRMQFRIQMVEGKFKVVQIQRETEKVGGTKGDKRD